MKKINSVKKSIYFSIGLSIACKKLKMKKNILGMIIFASIAITLNAQPRAIGGRLGGDIEFSYQHQLGHNMLDATAGFWIKHDYTTIGVAGVYDWVFPVNSWRQKGSWNWYAGPGAGFGLTFGKEINIPVNLAIGGQIGIEYQFWFPLNLSLDYRPMINIVGFNSMGIHFYGIALGVRYRF
jgi:hypothetical protein